MFEFLCSMNKLWNRRILKSLLEVFNEIPYLMNTYVRIINCKLFMNNSSIYAFVCDPIYTLYL